jgi:flavin-dependent dehydrogenase
MTPLPTHAEYDVAVIGGGPGGAALTTLLARQGHRCVLFEQARFPIKHVGESLVPQTYDFLERLGVLPQLRALAFPAKHCVRFVSPDGQASIPFQFAENLAGERAQTWQVERSQFDCLLLNHARANGVEVQEQTAVAQVLFEGGQAVGVQAVSPHGEAMTIRTRVVVDASGRACLLGRQLGVWAPLQDLRKAAIWTHYRGAPAPVNGSGHETTIFRTAGGGWFWHVPQPDQIVSVGLVASPDDLFANSDDIEAAFNREFARCAGLRTRLTGASRFGPLRGLRHLAYLNRQTCGAGWVMIGDARAFLDPIYSSGIYLALASAELAAGSIHEALRTGDVSGPALGVFEPALTQGLDVLRRLIHAFYDPQFSFPEFLRQFPDQRAALVDCLIGDVLKDLSGFTEALAKMTPPPAPLGELPRAA